MYAGELELLMLLVFGRVTDTDEKYTVTEVNLVSPPHLNKTKNWQMDALNEIWGGQDIRYSIPTDVFVYKRKADGSELIMAQTDNLDDAKCVDYSRL